MKKDLEDMIENCNVELSDIDKKLCAMHSFDETKKYLTKYALIKASGTVEYVYRSIVADYFSQFNIVQIECYLDNKIRKGSCSALYGNMKNILGQFDNNWEKEFSDKVKNRIDKDKLVKSADSLVKNRHAFAHGREPSATFSDIMQYYKDVLVLIQIFDSIVQGS